MYQRTNGTFYKQVQGSETDQLHLMRVEGKQDVVEGVFIEKCTDPVFLEQRGGFRGGRGRGFGRGNRSRGRIF